MIGCEEHAEYLGEVTTSGNAELHAGHFGELCTDEGDGTCRDCGVALVECLDCAGVGYHHPSCAEVDR